MMGAMYGDPPRVNTGALVSTPPSNVPLAFLFQLYAYNIPRCSRNPFAQPLVNTLENSVLMLAFSFSLPFFPLCLHYPFSNSNHSSILHSPRGFPMEGTIIDVGVNHHPHMCTTHDQI